MADSSSSVASVAIVIIVIIAAAVAYYFIKNGDIGTKTNTSKVEVSLPKTNATE